MTKIILNTLLVTLIFGSGVAYAENATNTATSSNTQRPKPAIFNKVKDFVQEKRDIKLDAKVKVETKKEERKENREERRDDRKESIRDIWKRNLSKMLDRFQATIDRENKILAKIVARIEKVKTAGGNTTESEKFVAEAKIHFGEAQTSLNSLKTLINVELGTTTATSTASTTPVTKESLERIRTATKKVKDHIKAGHSAMIRAVVNLKGVSGTRPATTTPAVTATTTATSTSSN